MYAPRGVAAVMIEALPPTQLNAAALPTTEALNAGSHPGREQRLLQRRSHATAAAKTAAYVSAHQVEAYRRGGLRWMGSPEEREADFASRRGRDIADGYVRRFERFLYRIHLTCLVHFMDTNEALGGGALQPDETEWMAYSDVIYVCIGAVSAGQQQAPRRIELRAILTRPCAEAYGFFRLVLYELARTCVHFGAALDVVAPTPATVRILQRSGVPFTGRATFEEGGRLRAEPRHLHDAAAAFGVAEFLA